MNECCEHNPNGCNWAVGHNQPSDLPDSVEHFTHWEDAFDYFVDLCDEFGVKGYDRDTNYNKGLELLNTRTGEVFFLVAM